MADSRKDTINFDKLESGIDKICNDLKQQVFGEAKEIDKQDWMQQAIMPDCEWLSQLDKIRERVHKASKVPMLHINEHGAEKMLQRLHQEQKKSVNKLSTKSSKQDRENRYSSISLTPNLRN